MFSALGQINFLAVAACVVFSFVFAGVWFALIVAKPYNIALGRAPQTSEKPAPLFIIGPVICNLFSVMTSALLIKTLGLESISSALAFGLLIGIGYIMATCTNIAINPNFPRPFLYAAINAPYFIINSLVTSIILVSMK